MYFLALYLKKHIELILLCCVYSAININFGFGENCKGAKQTRPTNINPLFTQTKLLFLPISRVFKAIKTTKLKEAFRVTGFISLPLTSIAIKRGQ